MTQHHYRESIDQEIMSLNWIIDEKIVRGLSYRPEAKHHRELIRQARKMRRRPMVSRMLSLVSIF